MKYLDKCSTPCGRRSEVNDLLVQIPSKSGSCAMTRGLEKNMPVAVNKKSTELNQLIAKPQKLTIQCIDQALTELHLAAESKSLLPTGRSASTYQIKTIQRVKASALACYAASGYSYLKASIGSNLDAFAAGKMPNSTPTAPENPSASSVAQRGTLAGGKSGMPLEISTPRP